MHKGLIPAVAACGLLVACSSSSNTSATASPSPTTGTETFSGSTTSTAQHPTIPLTATGVVTSSSGSITLSGPSGAGKATLHFANGTVTVEHSKGVQKFNLNKTNCMITFGETGTYKVLSGTGAYKTVTTKGHGTYAIKSTGTVPKKANGKCNGNANPNKGTALTTFKATGPLTVK